MKRLITFLASALLVFTSASAQTPLYSFKASTVTYTNLNSVQNVAPPDFADEADEMELTIPFDFTVYDEVFNKVSISAQGGAFFYSTTSTKIKAFFATNSELTPHDNTTGIYTELEGVTGSQIFKVEFRNFGLYSGDSTDYINFQIWLYEGSNAIEIHYGMHSDFDMTAYNTEMGPTVGFFEIDTATFDILMCYYLTGEPNSPVFHANVLSATDVPTLLNHVDPNTVYRFSKTGGNTSVEATVTNANKWSVYPNPSSKSKNITISFADAEAARGLKIALTNIDGQEVFNHTLAGEKHIIIDTEQLTPGMYLLCAQNNAGLLQKQKIVID